MVSRLYALLLRLLPRDRRERYGDEMVTTFAAMRDETRTERHRSLAMSALWMRETRALMTIATRDRMPRVAAFGRGLRSLLPGGGGFRNELRWAWRGVRARGARAWLVAALLGIALAANTLVFAVADSVVFTRVPYPRAHEIVEIRSAYGEEPTEYRFLTASLLDAWRGQTDLFSSVQAYLTKTIFVVANGRSEIMPAVDITPGLVELLGVKPRWGRSFTVDDARDLTRIPALISAQLASELYGDPESAIGKSLETTAYPLLVIGVMPADFAFPTGTYRIWRVFDPRGPLAQGFAGVQSIARTTPALPFAKLDEAVRARSKGIGESAGARSGYTAKAGEFYASRGDSTSKTTFWLLLLAGVCLLLTSCANIASLELANAVRRARTSAVQIALGASRSSLLRVTLLEGVIVVGGALVIAAGLSWATVGVLSSYLPALYGRATNPIDLDGRALVFMALAAGAVWLLTALPAVISAFRVRVTHLLRSDDRHGAGSRAGASVRRALTVLEVAVAVVLVVSGLAYARSYLALLQVDKGFDSRNLAGVSFAIPVEYYDSTVDFAGFRERVVAQLRSVPGVTAVARATPPPSMNTSSPFGGVQVEVDGAIVDGKHSIGDGAVHPEYFTVIGLPLRQGRWFQEPEAATSAIVTEDFARRFWPDGQAVGRSFRRIITGGREQPRLDVIGVVGNFRGNRPDRVARGTPSYYYYTATQPPVPPPATAKPPVRSTGGSWRFLNLTVRLDSLDRRDAVLAAARAVDPRLRVTFTPVDDSYAEMFSDVLLATRVTGAFGVVAFLVAAIGIYGVMSFLVASRQREIGVRVALGADRADINRLVVGSSLRLVVGGALLGLGAAVLASRYLQAQLYAVSATDPLTYAGVALAVTAVALLATWQPARTAARVDPAITLRAE